MRMPRAAVCAVAAAASCGAVDPGVGQYVANLVTINMPNEVVTSLLDPGLELGAVQPAGIVPDGQHPIIFCFGQQREVHPTVHIGNLPFNWAYSEFIMAIPFVYLTDGKKGPFNFNARLFLDNTTHYADAQQAIVAGWAYSLAKKAATITTVPANPWGLEDHTYQISDRQDSSKSFLKLSAHVTTGWKAPSEFPNFAPIAQSIDTTLIGDTSVAGKDGTGKYKCSQFHWHLERALIASLEGELDIDFSYLPGLPKSQNNFTGVASGAFGAFRLATNWTISMPGQECTA